jgi:hypothetical protein
MLVGLSLSAYRRQRLPYIYDRCFFESSFSSGLFPVSVCPDIRWGLSFNELISSQLIVNSRNVVLILFRLFFGLVGFVNIEKKVVPLVNNRITVLFYASLSWADLRCLNTFVFFLDLLAGTVNPLFVVQSALVSVRACDVGFDFINVRFDRFAHLRWLEVIYSFVAAGTFFGRSRFCYDRFLLFSLGRLFGSSRVTQNILLSLTTGLRPKYFDYERVAQGLSFKLVYKKSKKFRKIC